VAAARRTITERRHSGATLTRRATRPNPHVYTHRRLNAGAFRKSAHPRQGCRRPSGSPATRCAESPEFAAGVPELMSVPMAFPVCRGDDQGGIGSGERERSAADHRCHSITHAGGPGKLAGVADGAARPAWARQGGSADWSSNRYALLAPSPVWRFSPILALVLSELACKLGDNARVRSGRPIGAASLENGSKS
jgi:hypothetical protein